MNSRLFKSLPIFSSSNVNVDRENGIIKNTRVADFGKNKNGSFFDELFLNQLLKAGNEAPKGIKSRFGHPNMCSTSLGTYIGRYKNFQIKEGNLYADLHLDEITKKTAVEGKGIMMFDYIMDMAENNSDVFGNSIHIFSEEYEKEIDGKLEYLHNLEKFKAVDLVDDPAATNELFSSNPDDLGIIVTNFLDSHPKIFEIITEKPSIMSDFFERYDAYSKRKSLNFNTMSFLDKLKKQFSNKDGDKFDLNITLADGMIVTVKTDAEQPQVGDDVVDDKGTPVADGEHLLPDGGSLVTTSGKITEIKDKPTDNPPAEPTTAEVMQEVVGMKKMFEAMMSKVDKRFDQIEEGTLLMAADTAKKFEAIGKEIKSKEFDYDGLEDQKGKGTKGTYDPEKAKEFREKTK